MNENAENSFYPLKNAKIVLYFIYGIGNIDAALIFLKKVETRTHAGAFALQDGRDCAQSTVRFHYEKIPLQ